MTNGAPEPAATLIRTLPEAVALVGSDGRIVDATDRLGRLLDRDVEDLLDVSLETFFAAESRGDLARTLASMRGSEVGEAELERLVFVGTGGRADVDVTVAPWSEGSIAVIRPHAQSADHLLASMLDAVSASDLGTEVVEGVLREIGQSFGWDRATMWLVDDRTGLLQATAVWERAEDEASAYRERVRQHGLAPDQGLPGQAWSMAATLVPERFDDDPRFAGDAAPATAVFHPVRAGGRTVGVLELLSDSTSDPTSWIETSLTGVEPALGHLLARLRDRLAVDVAESRLSVVLDAGEFGVATFERRADWAEWSAGMAELHGLDPVRRQGSIGELLERVHLDDVGDLREAIARARLGAQDPESVDYRVRREDGTSHWINTRITASELPGGRVMVAAISADVTEDRQSAHRVRRRAMAVEGLQWVTQALISGRELHDTAAAVAHAATGVLGATLGVVLYLKPAENGDDMAWAVSGLPADIDAPSTPHSVELPGDLEEATRSIALDLGRHPAVRNFVTQLGLPVERMDLRSALVVPVRGQANQRLGTMLFLHVEEEYFTEDDVRLAHAIGASTGVAIENAQRHEHQRLVAAAFQQEMLPPSDLRVEGAEVCARYHPGRAGLDIGGDWYDVIPLESHRVGLAVGDVCGHGLAAAAHMGQFRYSFRALVQSSIDPAEAMRTLNRMAIHELRTTVTAVYVELDLRTGECRIWRCGHLPPVVAPANAPSARWLGQVDHRSPMLGFVDELSVAPAVDHLAPGDVLLLYTDGLVERRGETIDEGMERLREALVTPASDLDSLCDQLYGLLVDAAAAEDDTAMLAIRRT